MIYIVLICTPFLLFLFSSIGYGFVFLEIKKRPIIIQTQNLSSHLSPHQTSPAQTFDVVGEQAQLIKMTSFIPFCVFYFTSCVNHAFPLAPFFFFSIRKANDYNVRII
jgi:hypothetical protein